MINLADIIQLKFPEVDLRFQVQVFDDGSGPYIKKWDESLGPFPTDEVLAQWEQDVLSDYNAKQFKIINRSVLDQLEAIDIKTIRALRTNDQDRINQLEQEAAQLRAQLIHG